MFKIQGYGSKLLVLAGFCLFFGSVFSLLAMSLAGPLFDLQGQTLSTILNNVNDPQNVEVLKFLQLFNSLGIFVFPPILFVYFFSKYPLRTLSLNTVPKASYFVWVFLLFVLSLPLLNWLVEWNSQLELPDMLSGIENWMRESEAQAMELTEALLKMDDLPDLFFNIFLIALIPAVGEELLFRGLIQKYIGNWAKNYHIGIWISAILFSALHLQFFGFFPRMALGVLFGYLLVSTGSLWLPIFAHFTNNASALIASYFYGFNSMENEMDKIGTTDDSISLLMLSIVLFSMGLYYFFKNARKNQELREIN